MATFLKRAAAALIVVLALLALAMWGISRDAVTRLRSMAEAAPPVPPHVAAAIRAAEGFPSDWPPQSPRSLLPPRRGTIACAPVPAYVLVRWVSPPRRALRWHFETAVRTLVVERLFTPDELLRIFAHEVYLGRIDGKNIMGVEAASRTYFGKPARDLSITEAATVAAWIRYPNLKDSPRVLQRRNRVLAHMREHYNQDPPPPSPNTSSAARTP